MRADYVHLAGRAVWQKNGVWSSTRIIPKGPELNYEAGFAITAQSRSFLLLMSDRKPTTKLRFLIAMRTGEVPSVRVTPRRIVCGLCS